MPSVKVTIPALKMVHCCCGGLELCVVLLHWRRLSQLGLLEGNEISLLEEN